MRKIAVKINCGKKYCGECEWEHISCLLFKDKHGNRTPLTRVGHCNTRCQQCLDAEIRGE